jgi:hypothetical protein
MTLGRARLSRIERVSEVVEEVAAGLGRGDGGALDRLFEEVLPSRSRSALRGEREEDAALPVSWR